MRYALLFSGQGTQHADMLGWLESSAPAAPALDAMTHLTGADWRAKLREGGCRSSNSFAQPLIVGTALAAWSALAELLPSPLAVAGYSVGEVAAYAAAGVCTVEHAIALSHERARLMDAATSGVATGLVAVSGVTEADVLAACPDVECAIRIGHDQNLFGGTRDALARLRELLPAAEFKPICVALASHTSWTRPAVPAFARAIEAARLAMPGCAVLTNATGGVCRDPHSLATALAAQIGQTVQWASCMSGVAERRPACVVEVGGGQALARMWSARYPDIPARSLDEFRSAEGAAAWISRQQVD